MPTFEYIAISSSGERQSGELAAPSRGAAMTDLAGRKLTALSVQQVADSNPSGPASKSGPPASGLAKLRIQVTAALGGGGRVSDRSLAGAYGQIADLLRAGVPLLRALSLLGSMKSSPVLAASFADLAAQVAAGTDMAEAMKQRPRVFKSVHIAMVRAGERGGFLEPVMLRLSQLVLSSAEMRSKIVGNLIYPALLIIVGAGIMSVIFGYFIPLFRPVYERMPDLGMLTKGVLAMSTIVRTAGIPVLIALPFIVLAIAAGIRTPQFNEWWGRAHLKIPVMGGLSRAISAARFCRILGAMLANGVPVLTALAIAKDAAGSSVMERAIADAAEAVRQGQRLAEPLAASGMFAEDVIEMIRVGEQANSLGEVLTTVADTLESRVDRLLSGAVRLIEPLMLIVLAVVIGLVALALILPMTRISQAV